MAPPHVYRQLYLSGSIWSSPGAYGRIIIILLLLSINIPATIVQARRGKGKLVN
jgi:hypothetical protein